MYFDPNNDLNEDTCMAIDTLADALLYGEEGELEHTVGTWITWRMLYGTTQRTNPMDHEEDEFVSVDQGYEVETVESVEDFLNEGNREENWKHVESICIEAQQNWIRNVLKEIINGEHEIDGEIRRYISKIPDQENLAAYIEDQLDTLESKRKAWLDDFIHQSIVMLIMQYRDAAAKKHSSYQQQARQQQELQQKADQSSGKVMAACDAAGGLKPHYSIEEVDEILDLLEGVVDGEDITENDIAHFVRVNAARFDEDVMYLLGTRFPILDDEES